MTRFLQHATQGLIWVNRQLTQRRKNFILASNFLILFVLLGIILTLNNTQWVPLVSTQDGKLMHSITQELDLAAIDYRIQGDSICVGQNQYARAILQLNHHRIAAPTVLSATAKTQSTIKSGNTQPNTPGVFSKTHELQSIGQGR